MKNKLLLFLILFATFTIGYAQIAGNLNTSFGINGKVTSNFGQANFNVRSQAIQTDGKIVLVGNIENYSTFLSFVTRLNSDGSLDTSFNGTGKVINEFIDNFEKVLIQTDGKIIIGGNSNQDIALARYNSDGSLDTTFDTDGMLYNSNQQNSNKSLNDFDLQINGKIVVLSDFYGANQDYRVTRFNSDGTIDALFGVNGTITTDIGNTEFSKSILIQSDNKILVGGTTNNNLGTNIFLARYSSSGTLDTTFNIIGKKIINYTNVSNNNFSNLALQVDGKILFSSETYVGSIPKIYLSRINSNGSFDTTFDTDGTVITNSPNTFAGSNGRNGILKIQSDNKIFILTQNSSIIDGISNTDFLLFKYNSNGSLDTTFDSDGFLNSSYFSNNDYVGGLGFFNGKIIISGNTEQTKLENKIAVAKINNNGTFDSSFDADGKVAFTFPLAASDEASTSIIQADGKILVGGSSYFNNQRNYSIARYNSDGSLDISFGINGSTVIFASYSYGNIVDMQIDINGKIILAADSFAYVTIIRLNPNGSIDSSFGSGGYAVISDSFGQIQSMKLLTDGKIMVSGSMASTINGVYSGNNLLARFNSNGTLDTTFGSNGISNLGSTDGQDNINKIAIQSNGKIIGISFVFNGSDNDIKVLRYNSNGTLDTSFNGNGIVTFGTVSDDYPTDVVIQNDQKIIISSISDFTKFIMTRLTTNGSYDTTFDSDGVVETQVQFYSELTTLKILDNQKILAIGTSSTETGDNDFTFLKYNSDGSLDVNFGNQGVVLTDFYGYNDIAQSVVITTDNSAIISGSSYDPNNLSVEFSLAKYHLDSNLSVPENNFQKELVFYPNPANDKIYLSEEVKSVTLYTVDGKFVNSSLENNIINVSNLAKGIYFVQYLLKSNIVETQRLIKN